MLSGVVVAVTESKRKCDTGAGSWTLSFARALKASRLDRAVVRSFSSSARIPVDRR